MMPNSGPSGCPRCGQIDYARRVAGIARTDQGDLGVSLRPAPPPAPPRRRSAPPPEPGDPSGWSPARRTPRLAQFWVVRGLRRWREEPEATGPAMAVLLAIAIVWLVPSCVLASGRHSTDWGWLFVYCSVPVAFLLYHFFGSHTRRLKRRLEMERYEERKGRYDLIMQLWREMEYCGRCHGVYLPGHEWQADVNPGVDLVAPDHAWRWAEQLALHASTFEGEIVVTDRGVVEQAR